MDLKKNLNRLQLCLNENPNHDIEEILELIIDAPATELRASAKQVTDLCHTLTEILTKTRRSVAGLNLLDQTITKLQSHRSQLTTIHADLCALCLDAQCLNPALKYLETDYTDISISPDNKDEVKQIMLFYYYGGLIYTALKQFEKASFYFEVVLTMPANSMNLIMQETYKKQIIITLLIDGKLPENLLPKYTSPCVLSQRKSIAGAYLKFAQDYSSLDMEKIKKTFQANTQIFEKDENVGLLKQCMAQIHKRNIQRLTKTFLQLPLKDVADHVGLKSQKEAEQYIINMIDDGEIYASINQKDGMVLFQDSPETYESVKVFQKLQDDMSVCTDLIGVLKKLIEPTGVETRANRTASASRIDVISFDPMNRSVIS